MGMNRFLIVQFSRQKWGIGTSYVVEAALLPKTPGSERFLPEQICLRNRVVPIVDPAQLLETVAYSPNPPRVTKAVVISRGNLWLGLAVDEVLAAEKVESSHATWTAAYIPVGIRRDLIQGVGTLPNGDPLLLIDSEALISAWQHQTGQEAFPLPSGSRLGEKILETEEKSSYPGPDRRGHLRLERTERVLIQKSKESGYPAYRTVISLQKNLREDSVGLARVIKLLQQLGIVVGGEAVYQSKTLGKYGRHLGLFYITHHPPETILDRLHELEEVDKAELISFRA